MTTRRRLRRIYTQDPIVNQIQNNINEVLDGISLCNLLDGNLVSANLAAGSVKVPHLLDRRPQGWIVVDKDGTADIWRNSWDSIFLELEATAPVSVTMWIF